MREVVKVIINTVLAGLALSRMMRLPLAVIGT
jgi:hypothetical protein